MSSLTHRQVTVQLPLKQQVVHITTLPFGWIRVVVVQAAYAPADAVNNATAINIAFILLLL